MGLEDIFEKAGYNIGETITTQGSLVKMKKYDCARLLSDAITLSSLDIFQPVDLEAQVAMEQEEIRKELEGETKAVDTYEDLKYVRTEMEYDPILKLYRNEIK